MEDVCERWGLVGMERDRGRRGRRKRRRRGRRREREEGEEGKMRKRGTGKSTSLEREISEHSKVD